ncbi:hypothetical protein ACFE04_008419 [Oxalis oulophora]
MKKKASGLLKQIITMVTTIVKAKSLALKRKTNAMRARIIIFSLLHRKNINLVSTISQKLHAISDKARQHDTDSEDDEQSKAIVLREENHSYNAMSSHEEELLCDTQNHSQLLIEYGEEDEDDKYPDLTHTLFEEEGGSVIEMVKNSKEAKGKEFVLEDEIDSVAEMFIKKFHHQMRMQKQLSFNRISLDDSSENGG